jgi:hypothetical protein
MTSTTSEPYMPDMNTARCWPRSGCKFTNSSTRRVAFSEVGMPGTYWGLPSVLHACRLPPVMTCCEHVALLQLRQSGRCMPLDLGDAADCSSGLNQAAGQSKLQAATHLLIDWAISLHRCLERALQHAAGAWYHL